MGTEVLEKHKKLLQIDLAAERKAYKQVMDALDKLCEARLAIEVRRKLISDLERKQSG